LLPDVHGSPIPLDGRTNSDDIDAIDRTIGSIGLVECWIGGPDRDRAAQGKDY
jgi:hypothetical protein